MMRRNGIPVVNTRAMGQAFLFPARLAQAAQPAQAPAQSAALEEARSLHKAMGARYEDLVALLGRTKADIMVGQAAQAVEAAKAAATQGTGQ